jgi:hypothetical protein
VTKFIYLFRSNPAAYQSMSPEQMQQTMKKWMDWKDALEKNGHVHQLGERLVERVRWSGAKPSPLVTALSLR